jgi:flagellar basal-body rod protein FlgG
MKEMVNLISATRAYEASQKVVQAVDETMGIAINDVGAVS